MVRENASSELISAKRKALISRHGVSVPAKTVRSVKNVFSQNVASPEKISSDQLDLVFEAAFQATQQTFDTVHYVADDTIVIAAKVVTADEDSQSGNNHPTIDEVIREILKRINPGRTSIGGQTDSGS